MSKSDAQRVECTFREQENGAPGKQAALLRIALQTHEQASWMPVSPKEEAGPLTLLDGLY